MKVLTVLQFISIFTIYTGLFIAVPALLLHRRLKDEIFSVRFFFYHYMFVITSLLLHFVLPDISDLLCVCQPVFLTQKSFYNPAIGQFHIPDTEWLFYLL